MSLWGENHWRSDKRFPRRLELKTSTFYQPLFTLHYVLGLALSCKIYRDAKRWRTRTHTKAVIKEGERIHYFALQKQAAAATATPAERELLRVVTPHGTRELIEADLKPAAGHH